MYTLLKINESEYKMRLSLNALSEFKVLNNGIGFTAMMDGRGDIDIPEMILLVHVALKAGDKFYSKTVEETGDLLDELMAEEGFSAIEGVLLKLIESLQGKKKKPQNKVAKKK